MLLIVAVTVVMIVAMVVIVVVMIAVTVMMIVAMGMGVLRVIVTGRRPMSLRAGLDAHLAISAAARYTHHSTSIFIIFSSSPPVSCNWWLPHSGQASKRCVTGTDFSQGRHQAVACVWIISSRAFSASVPFAATSKQNIMASGSMAAS